MVDPGRISGARTAPGGTRIWFPPKDFGVSVYGLFAGRTRETPDKPAVVAGSTTITYAELDGRVNRTARHLLDAGAGPTVAVVLDDTVEVLVGVLAVLAAGKAFTVPDPDVPVGELDRLLARAGAVVTREEFRPRIESRLVVCLDSDARSSRRSPLNRREHRRATWRRCCSVQARGGRST
jgi:non-ribosomal peptide synthetase component F